MGGLLGGGGGQTRPATYSFGGNPAAYIPTGQPAADQTYQNILGAFTSAGLDPFGAYASNIGNLTQQLYNNPYAGQAQTAANTLGILGQNIGGSPIVVGQDLLSLATPLEQAGKQVASTAFDPQQELYNATLQKIQDQAAASAAASGLAGSPYAAGLANDAISNFNIDWQNQQLARQMQGLQGLTQADLGAGQLGAQGAALQNQGLGTIMQSAMLPYQTSIGQAQTGLQGLNQLLTLPQQTLNDLQSYLGLGQAASGLAGGLGGQGFNQNLQSGLGLAGLTGIGNNLLFGNQGLSGALGLGNGGLFQLLFGGGGQGFGGVSDIFSNVGVPGIALDALLP